MRIGERLEWIWRGNRASCRWRLATALFDRRLPVLNVYVSKDERASHPCLLPLREPPVRSGTTAVRTCNTSRYPPCLMCRSI
ncbi:hypothetical protein [Kamptonema formosum]|uniref:hypothetical protein n=1 Tax=Kamptonema formosum TaxID=331992 RepID=UPI0012DE3A32|nr:hypothetical protein [Oscillatoria sp. PCC 10802]